MTKRSQIIAVSAAFAIIAAAALFLFTWEKRQHLGKPGVRVIDVPMEGIDVSAAGTNHFVAGAQSIYLPEKVLDYISYPNPVTRLVWDWLPKDTTYGQRIYRDTNGFRIQTMAVLMGKDRTSIHQPQYCVTGTGWRIVSQQQVFVAMDEPLPYELPVMKLKLTQTVHGKNGEEHEIAGVLVYWFVADNQLTADHRQRMWWMARDLLRHGVLQRWAYIVEFSQCRPGDEELTFARISDFIRASVPQYQLTPKLPQVSRAVGARASTPAAIAAALDDRPSSLNSRAH
jgi:hypothetical protein